MQKRFVLCQVFKQLLAAVFSLILEIGIENERKKIGSFSCEIQHNCPLNKERSCTIGLGVGGQVGGLGGSFSFCSSFFFH